MFGMSELVVVLLVVIAVLAAKKLPELTRSAGKSARIFKAEKRAMDEGAAEESATPRVVQGEVVTDSGRPQAQGGATDGS